MSRVLFAFRLPQQACEGGNDIACSRTTQDLLSQKNCDLIPAQCALTSSFKLLMFFCLFVLLLLHKSSCSTFCAGVSGSAPPIPLSKKHTHLRQHRSRRSRAHGVRWTETWKRAAPRTQRNRRHRSKRRVCVWGGGLPFGLFSWFRDIFGSVELPKPCSVTEELTQTDSSVIKNNINFI